MERFAVALAAGLPRAKLSLDRPERGGGSWWLDATLGTRAVTIEWKPSMGFGVSSLPSEGFGDGPDEFFDDEKSALARVAHLLRTGKRTQVASQLALKRLRETCRVSQVQLAERMNTTQGAISKLERNPNPSVATLRDWVEALGGDLEIRARFGEDTVKVAL